MMIFLKNDHYQLSLFCKSGFPADILKNFTFFQKKNHPFFRSTTFFRPSYGGKCTCVEFILIGSLWPAWVGRGRVLLASK